MPDSHDTGLCRPGFPSFYRPESEKPTEIWLPSYLIVPRKSCGIGKWNNRNSSSLQPSRDKLNVAETPVPSYVH